MIDTVSVGVGEDANLAGAGGSITRASSFFAAIQLLNIVGPDKVEGGLRGVDAGRRDKRTLGFELVELIPLRLLPIALIYGLQEFAAGQFHSSCDAVDDTAVVNIPFKI